MVANGNMWTCPRIQTDNTVMQVPHTPSMMVWKSGLEFIATVTIGDHMRSISQNTKVMMYSSSSPSEVGSLMRTQDGISIMSASRWATSVNQEHGPVLASQSPVKMHSTGES